MPDAACLIFFDSRHQPLTLDDAQRLLTEAGLRVTAEGNALSVRWEDGAPVLRVSHSAATHVAEEAAEIARGRDAAQGLARCDARFEIAIDDLDEALDEMNTLIETQSTLQDASGGYLFNSWNGELTSPED